jgi:ketol-acid reductoisomerase
MPPKLNCGQLFSNTLPPEKRCIFPMVLALPSIGQTGIVPPKDVDVFLVAPKGSGTSLRRMFLQGRGLNSSSYAIFQDATGKAFDRVVIALGIAVGSGYLFETDFQKRSIQRPYRRTWYAHGLPFRAYLLRNTTFSVNAGTLLLNHFNETVEELTQSLMPLVAENGMDWMYANCSTTAQRGALDWWKKFRDATMPVFNELYDSVAAGKESQRSIDSNSKADYREGLEKELAELRDSELWQAGKTVRSLRPENQASASGIKVPGAEKANA